ncbi:MAG TPA: imidazole glycerol phosphate synthase subunit HisH [Acidobacteriaceae bacterium]|jgi:glutamine amidotransferase|nr:imidazole glycerol phosphate synthase subunit HisH [Acidobacteriaceae bacterium]
MIAVVDYRAGNLTSVVKALRALGVDPVVTADPAALRTAEKIILPGVGHFAATERLFQSGMAAAIQQRVAQGALFLGICVGLQWIFRGSTEAPAISGLNVFPETCERFPNSVKSPHVGWNSLDLVRPSRLLDGLEPSTHVYFTHSYRAPAVNATVAVTNYAGNFSAAVEEGNWMAVQFHPEKSGPAGLKILKNFLDLPNLDLPNPELSAC